uniref:P-type phospholipid transporter n=1 Tax=Panagrolaimus sp. PS1159 TaxID=55785 RepID=A0AC35FEQ3_9BILA
MKDLGTSPSKEIHTTEITNEVSTRDSQIHPLTIRTEDPLTYWGPLAFVLTITLIKEAIDDAVRLWRDNEINNETYEKLTPRGSCKVKSKDIKVGDLIVIHKDKRIPSDVVLLRTTEKAGTCFVRTDQLDGEKDWKLRVSIPPIQALSDNGQILNMDCEIYAEKPQKDIHAFIGTYKIVESDGKIIDGSLSVENVLWANTVLTSGTAIGLVIYTGYETRSVMNANLPETKVGLLDKEVNNLTKILFALVVLLSLVMVSLKRINVKVEKNDLWAYIFQVLKEMIRFILLFSYIIPISLRVNLDLAKISYSLLISRDKKIPKTIVRNSTIPEELGRISYLLSDKTGTLTNNVMKFKQ